MAKKFEDVEDFVSQVQNLPVLPANIQKINELMADENTSADDISKVVESDQALATKMLKQANSAYYGRISKVVKVNDAVVLIGMTNIKSMLYSIFVNQLYGGSRKVDPIMVDLWKHSVSTAIMARKIMEAINPAQKDATYTAGLLHDIGELILFTYENKTYLEVLGEIAVDDVMSRTAIEESVMGFSHTDLGAVLARKWNLPRMIKNAIFFHHNTVDCDCEEDHQIVAAVHIADKLCVFSGVGGTDQMPKGKTLKDIIIPDAITQTYIDDEKLEKYLLAMSDVKSEAEMFMEIMKK